MSKKELILTLIFITLFITFFVWFSNYYAKKVVENYDTICQGRFDTSFDCINNGVCDCTKGRTND